MTAFIYLFGRNARAPREDHEGCRAGRSWMLASQLRAAGTAVTRDKSAHPGGSPVPPVGTCGAAGRVWSRLRPTSPSRAPWAKRAGRSWRPTCLPHAPALTSRPGRLTLHNKNPLTSGICEEKHFAADRLGETEGRLQLRDPGSASSDLKGTFKIHIT